MDGMTGCVNTYIWSKHYVIPYGDLSYIQHHTVSVGIKILSDFDMASVFAVERRLKIYIFLMFDSCTLQTLHTFFRFKGHYLIILPDDFFYSLLLCHNRIIGDVWHLVISSVNVIHSFDSSCIYVFFQTKLLFCPLPTHLIHIVFRNFAGDTPNCSRNR